MPDRYTDEARRARVALFLDVLAMVVFMAGMAAVIWATWTAACSLVAGIGGQFHG